MTEVFYTIMGTLDNNDDFKKFVLEDLDGSEEVDTVYINSSMAIVVTIGSDPDDNDITIVRPRETGRVGDMDRHFITSVENTIKTEGVSNPLLRKRTYVKWGELIKSLDLLFDTDKDYPQSNALVAFMVADSANFKLKYS